MCHHVPQKDIYTCIHRQMQKANAVLVYFIYLKHLLHVQDYINRWDRDNVFTLHLYAFSCQLQSDDVEYSAYSRFQSHVPEFDCLQSTEISERITDVQWVGQTTASSHLLLSTNSKKLLHDNSCRKNTEAMSIFDSIIYDKIMPIAISLCIKWHHQMGATMRMETIVTCLE